VARWVPPQDIGARRRVGRNLRPVAACRLAGLASGAAALSRG